jgi:hypothetical protein
MLLDFLPFGPAVGLVMLMGRILDKKRSSDFNHTLGVIIRRVGCCRKSFVIGAMTKSENF